MKMEIKEFYMNIRLKHGRTGPPGDPVGSPAKWAATSNVEIGQMRRIVGPQIPKFKIKVLSEVPGELSLQPCWTRPVCLISQGRFEKPVRSGLKDEVYEWNS